MKRMIRLRNSLLFMGGILVLFAAIPELSATTLYVGNCKPNGYTTIQQAIDAAHVGGKVQVCPGEYYEQVKITRAVTVQGITDNSGDCARIFPPTSGLVANVTDAYGRSVSAQVLVQNSGGMVNLSGFYINAFANKVTSGDLAGIFYQNSSGTINGVTAYGQTNGGDGIGVGIWVEGGAAKPSVTVQNSMSYSASYASIVIETSGQPNSHLTARVANNSVWVPSVNNGNGIVVVSGATVTISGNSVTSDNHGYGLWIGPDTTGSVSDNDITGAQVGIKTYADNVAI